MKTEKKQAIRARWGVLLATVFGITLAASGVENSSCVDCHEEQVKDFTTSAHGRAFQHNQAYAGQSCASCHLGAEAHAESGDPAEIVNPKKSTGLAASESCLSCHENQVHNAYWQGSAHEAAGLACMDCHAVHSPLRNRQGKAVKGTTDLCLSCHATTQVAMNQRSRHPLREGAMDCASCHDPHGSAGEKLVKGDSVNDSCLSCHQELRGPFLWEHSPVREDCLTCHKPHGSNHDKLLVARASQMCQSCHLQGRHQTVAGFDSSVWNSNRACLNCHSQIHGSNHPSGPLFQR